jgi:hypothetical protein
VWLIEPHSEADPAAVLVQFLAGFGSLIGRHAHFTVESDDHFMNIFVVIVGETSKGRKGTSLGYIQRVLTEIDGTWAAKRVMSGLASGEGLIWAVRDPIWERKPVKQNGRIVRYEPFISDHGESDKRLLVTEPEFARVLQVVEREKNTLSAVVRQAWDTGRLNILTKNKAASATGSHVSVIGHITKTELRRLLTDTAAGNGFANRFLWVCARRSKCLPFGGKLGGTDLEPIINRLRQAVEFATRTHEMELSSKARKMWEKVYPVLSEGKPGLLGSVISRAEAQVVRLACIYTLLNRSKLVRTQHLKAALAVWRYCEASARFVFGDALGDSTADEILRVLRQHAEGMTRNDIREHFQHNTSSAEIARALSVLQEYGLARVEKDQTDGSPGRPTQRWFAIYAVREKRGYSPTGRRQ